MAGLTIIHFNDVYNIEPQKSEPVGGAARMKSYIKMCEAEHPLVLFSGDILNPSMMSIFLKGDQMIPVVNKLSVQCAVLGNHDFDFGVDHLIDFVEDTNFPWLMSNVKDNLTDKPLAGGRVTYMMEWDGIKIGLIGLVENEWIDTLATLDPEDVTYYDFVEEGRRLARELREQGADMIIALTHMRWPNDTLLAESVEEIDIILGGHDHDYVVKQVNGKYIIKSGTDFRNLSKVKMIPSESGWEVKIERVDLDSSYPEDPEVKAIVDEKLKMVDSKMDTHLGDMNVELDGRFCKVRTQETNLGNFITDIMLEANQADVAILNSGTLRSDRVHPKGAFLIRDLFSILPFVDNIVVIEVTGEQLVEALENGVSKYPALEGRFPQLSGVRFAFDPSKPRGHRVDGSQVLVQDMYLEMDKKYRLCTKEYLANGKDGYDVLKDCPILVSAEQCQPLSTSVENHFESVKMYKGEIKCRSGHRLSLVHAIRRQSLMISAVNAFMSGSKKSVSSADLPRRVLRQRSIHDSEQEMSNLAPRVDGRIRLITDEEKTA